MPEPTLPDPIFIAIVEQAASRVAQISTDDGYYTDIGEYGQQLLGLGVADIKNLPAGAIAIEPGQSINFEGEDGAVRQSTAPKESRPSRDISISVAIDLADRAQWLTVSERVAADVRKAMFANQGEWTKRFVVRLEQVSQDSGWPEVGSSTLVIQLTFRFTYVER